MRRALEVGWVSAYRFARSPPRFAGLDDVVFRKPVEVGATCEYVARVVFAASDGSLRVCVHAYTLELSTGERDMTNEFHLVFDGDAGGRGAGGVAPLASSANETSEHGLPPPLPPQVQPETYEEGMLYLEGRRRWMRQRELESSGAAGDASA